MEENKKMIRKIIKLCAKIVDDPDEFSKIMIENDICVSMSEGRRMYSQLRN